MTATMVALRTRQIPADLDKVLGFQLPLLVDRLSQKLEIARDEAEKLFEDTKRFLFLAATHLDPISPTPEIDEGWHAFILFTRDYELFCQENFGFFVHHAPSAPGQKTKTLRARFVARQVFGDNLSLNWGVEASGSSDCAPESNCEAPPADCATN